MSISTGDIWLKLNNFIRNNLDIGTYSIEHADTSFSQSLHSNQDLTGALFPITDFLISDKAIIAEAVFNLQLIKRIDGKNSYEQLLPFIKDGLNLSSDLLLLLTNTRFDESIVDIVNLEHDPLGISRLDGMSTSDWLIVISPKLKIRWNLTYSQGVSHDEVITVDIIEKAKNKYAMKIFNKKGDIDEYDL